MKYILINKPVRETIKVNKNNKVVVVMVVLRPGEYKVRIDLMVEGAKACLLVAMRAVKGDYVISTKTNHRARNTHAETELHGVLNGEAKAEVKGMIRIDKDCHQVTDFLTEKVLLMGDRVQAVAEPSLEIEADDVRASHAATVSKIDEEQLFYLMSRGISKSEAESVIEKGFLDEVLNKIGNGKIKKQVREQIYA